MTNTTIWHNPRCTKSRQTLQLLREHGIEPEIRLYLDEPPGRDELSAAVSMLGGSPRDLVRSKQREYTELGLEDAGDEALINALAEHPRLIERPLVIHDGRAALGRPPENALALFRR